nr:putative TPR repeat methyltransferase [Mucilaginibacter sp. X5P1]
MEMTYDCSYQRQMHPDLYTRKISTNTAIRILNQNDIRVNEDQAKEILNFLYLIAKTYNQHDDDNELF